MHTFQGAAIAVAVALASPLAAGAAVPGVHLAAAPAQRVAFSVDNVTLSVPRTFAAGRVFSGQPGDATQETTITDASGTRSLSVIAVPYGTRPGTESALAPAQPGGAGIYRNALAAYRGANGQNPRTGPAVTLFGTVVPGVISTRRETLTGVRGTIVRDVITTEWVAETTGRLWIVRAMQFSAPAATQAAAARYVSDAAALDLRAESPLNAPTTVFRDTASAPLARALAPQAVTTALSSTKPPNYSDTCDTANYNRKTGSTGWRNYLGQYYQGVPACGPRPAYGGIDESAIFYNGAPWGVLQFECVELSLRWMYLAYGTPPYSGNGDQLYANYSSSRGGTYLYKVQNTAGPPYWPHGGAVLSYETGGTGGHTSVVIGSSADGNGNGWVDVMEQNASYGGYARLTMTNYQVASNYGGYIIGWLTPTR